MTCALTKSTCTSVERRGRKADAAAVGALLRELSPLWKGHHRKGLDTRLRTGGRLNDAFGPPTVRQSYGAATFMGLSKALCVSVSDLSRMRWSAHHFGTLDALKAAHPTVTNWTQLKKLLASPKYHGPSVPGTAPGDQKKPRRSRSLPQVIRAIRVLQAHASGVEPTPDTDDLKTMREAMGEMLRVVGPLLGGEYHLMCPTTPGPVPGEASPAVAPAVSALDAVPADALAGGASPGPVVLATVN